MLKYIKISPLDNVAVAIEEIKSGDKVEGITAKEDISKGHKIALSNIKQNENVIKYGYAIGHATMDIKSGEHVHVHNIKTNLDGVINYKYEPNLKIKSHSQNGYFKGYVRKNGDVGIRNEIWIINTVGCVNKISEKIASEGNKIYSGKTDGIFTFVHPYGCSQMGDDQIHTQKILCDLVNHPNASGVLVLGLGCENNNIVEFKKVLGNYDEDKVKFLNAQDSYDEVEEGIKIIGELVKRAEKEKREDVPIEKLKIGLKCGGSDGFSGITANPLVGYISDKLVSYDGITVLTEVPEMFGAETLLMNRCENVELFQNTVKLINNFKEYFIKYNQVIYDNPSPGNKKGGISTLEDKSLGCTQKGGSSNVVNVLSYGEVANVKGLNLLEGPGNDIVAVTGLAASGCHIVLFTTGRGTPLGGPVPTVKISSNTELANKKSSWIDFNAGIIVEDKTLEGAGDMLWDLIIKVASGEMKTKNEENGYREIAIFKDGVTL